VSSASIRAIAARRLIRPLVFALAAGLVVGAAAHADPRGQTVVLDRGLGPWKLGMVRTVAPGLIRTERHRDTGGCVGGPGLAALIDYYDGLRLSWNNDANGRPRLVEVATTRRGDRDDHGLTIGRSTIARARRAHPTAQPMRAPHDPYALGATELYVYKQLGYESGASLELWFNRAGRLVAIATGRGGC